MHKKYMKSCFSLTLTCNASGFPPPRIYWERQVGKIMSNHVQIMKIMIIKILTNIQ